MKTAALIFGVLSIVGMIVGFIPCLGAFNWLNIPFAIVGLVVSLIAYNKDDGQPKNPALSGIIMCSIAMLFGLVRLFLGGGVF
jgi:hypothetical protein